MNDLDLEEIAGLVTVWRDYLRRNRDLDDMTRDAGYRASLSICADQLEETVNRIRQSAVQS